MPFLSRSKVMVGVHEREESAVATNSPAVAGRQGGASTTDCLPCRHLPRCLCNINIPQNNKRKREVEEKEDDLATATEVTFLSMMGEMKDLLEQNSDQMTQMQVEIRHLRGQVVSMKGLLERHINNGNDDTNANLPLQAAEVAAAAAVEAGHAAARAKRMEISATATATAEQITTKTPTPTVLQQTPPRQVYYKTPEEVRKMIGQRIVKRNGWPVKSKPAHRFASDNELNQLRLCPLIQHSQCKSNQIQIHRINECPQVEGNTDTFSGKKRCVLCSTERHVRKSDNYCSLCCVPLCAKPRDGFLLSCFDAWHTVDDLTNEEKARKVVTDRDHHPPGFVVYRDHQTQGMPLRYFDNGVEVDVNGNPLNAEQIMKEGGGQEEEAKVDAQNGRNDTRKGLEGQRITL